MFDAIFLQLLFVALGVLLTWCTAYGRPFLTVAESLRILHRHARSECQPVARASIAISHDDAGRASDLDCESFTDDTFDRARRRDW